MGTVAPINEPEIQMNINDALIRSLDAETIAETIEATFPDCDESPFMALDPRTGKFVPYDPATGEYL